MNDNYQSNSYNFSLLKTLFDFITALCGLILFSPFVILISIMITTEDNSPIFFIQKRIGKNGKVFNLIKFRTMKVGSEKMQAKYKNLNEADGPVFKIRNDPRYTKFGKFLAHTGFDEIPQLINVLRGEMSIVGPRPLPVAEAKKIPARFRTRSRVKPGITSEWVIKGSHKLSFKEWMQLDKDYVENANLKKDIEIIFKTTLLILKPLVINSS